MYKKIVIIVILRYAFIGFLMHPRYKTIVQRQTREKIVKHSDGNAETWPDYLNYLWKKS